MRLCWISARGLMCSRTHTHTRTHFFMLTKQSVHTHISAPNRSDLWQIITEVTASPDRPLGVWSTDFIIMQISITNACKFKHTHMQPNSEPRMQDESKAGRVTFENPNSWTRCIHARTLSQCNFNARALLMYHINIFFAINTFLSAIRVKKQNSVRTGPNCFLWLRITVFAVSTPLTFQHSLFNSLRERI